MTLAVSEYPYFLVYSMQKYYVKRVVCMSEFTVYGKKVVEKFRMTGGHSKLYYQAMGEELLIAVK